MKMKVQIRPDWEVKPEARQLDGKVFDFVRGWEITEEDSCMYVGEVAMLPTYIDDYPISAPAWIASGDLVLLKDQS